MARGSIQKRVSAANGDTSYRARVEFPADPVTGKRRQLSETFPTRKAAQSALATWLADIERGTAVDTSTMTVADFMRHWLDTVAAHKVRATTLADYRHTIEKHIVPALGGHKVQRLTPAVVQRAYADKLAAGIGGRTVQLMHQRLSQALAQGVRWGTVSRNVCDAVEPPRVQASRPEPWTPTEARAFLAAAAGDERSPLWLMALATGARQGELLGLRWQDVDLSRGSVTIRQAVAVLDGRVIFQAPKSRAAVRQVTLPADAVETLRAHQLAQRRQRVAAGDAWEDHDLVHATPLGLPYHPSNVLRSFYALMERAGVRRVRFHDMRHAHATWLVADGHSLPAVAERLGHSKSSITLDVYSHVVAASRDRAAASVGGWLRGDDDDVSAPVPDDIVTAVTAA